MDMTPRFLKALKVLLRKARNLERQLETLKRAGDGRRRTIKGYYLARQDSHNCHGYQLRVGNSKTKKGYYLYSRYFGDFTYGGKRNAKRAAKDALAYYLEHGKLPPWNKPRTGGLYGPPR